MYRKTLARIDLSAIRKNYSIATSLAPESKNIAVIKANAYGHGMVQVAETLQDVAPAFAVATIDEAIELRNTSSISHPLLVLEGVNDVEGLELAAANNLSLMVFSQEQVQRIAEVSINLPLWLKVDTGMHRLGLAPEELQSVLERLRGKTEILTVCTHLACADDLSNDATRKQLELFKACVAGIDLPLSISNSAGILAWPASHADWNRPGYMLYGASPMTSNVESAHALHPAMTLQSEIIAISTVPTGDSVGYGARWTASQPTVVGTVAAGYGDGYPRHAPNGTPTLVNGQVAPLVGAVSMDMLTVDLTAHETVAVGDSVELWGQSIAISDVANRSSTIGYELMTGVSARVPRLYQE